MVAHLVAEKPRIDEATVEVDVAIGGIEAKLLPWTNSKKKGI